MPELELPRNAEFTGTLTLGFHPDGELHFEDGTATVEDDDVAAVLVDRYARIEYAGAHASHSDGAAADADGPADADGDGDGDSAAGDGGAAVAADGDADGDAVAEAPFDPSEYTVDEVRDSLADGDYADADLRRLRDAEEATADRVGVIEAIDDRLDE